MYTIHSCMTDLPLKSYLLVHCRKVGKRMEVNTAFPGLTVEYSTDKNTWKSAMDIPVSEPNLYFRTRQEHSVPFYTLCWILTRNGFFFSMQTKVFVICLSVCLSVNTNVYCILHAQFFQRVSRKKGFLAFTVFILTKVCTVNTLGERGSDNRNHTHTHPQYLYRQFL